jgi:transposase
MTTVDDIDTKPLLHDYMSQQDVAEELGVTVETLRRWRVHGAGPRWFRFGLGMRLMYNRQDVKDWIEQQREAAQPSAAIRGRAQWASEETVPQVADRVSNRNKARWTGEMTAPSRRKSRGHD